MSKSMIAGIIVAVLVIAGGVIWIVHSKNSNSMNSMGSNGSSSATVNGDNVTIQNFAFSPANITVKKGTTVTWTNKDSVAHTVAETDSLTGPDSSSLDDGQSYNFTFNATGTFHYHCSIHPNMTGTVTVTQ